MWDASGTRFILDPKRIEINPEASVHLPGTFLASAVFSDPNVRRVHFESRHAVGGWFGALRIARSDEQVGGWASVAFGFGTGTTRSRRAKSGRWRLCVVPLAAGTILRVARGLHTFSSFGEPANPTRNRLPWVRLRTSSAGMSRP